MTDLLTSHPHTASEIANHIIHQLFFYFITLS